MDPWGDFDPIEAVRVSSSVVFGVAAAIMLPKCVGILIRWLRKRISERG
jgi:hypothetical protein